MINVGLLRSDLITDEIKIFIQLVICKDDFLKLP